MDVFVDVLLLLRVVECKSFWCGRCGCGLSGGFGVVVFTLPGVVDFSDYVGVGWGRREGLMFVMFKGYGVVGVVWAVFGKGEVEWWEGSVMWMVRVLEG